MGLVVYNLSGLAKKLQAYRRDDKQGKEVFSPRALAFYLVQAYCAKHTFDWRTNFRLILDGNVDEMFYPEIMVLVEQELGNKHVDAQRAIQITLDGENVMIRNKKRNVVFCAPQAEALRSRYHCELPQISSLYADMIESALEFFLEEIISGSSRDVQNLNDEEYRDELFQYLHDDAWEVIFTDPKASMFRSVFERELYSSVFYDIIMATIQLAIDIAKSTAHSGEIRLDNMGERNAIHIKNKYVLIQMG